MMPRHIIISLEGHAGNPVDSYLPAVFQIDYVRIYKFSGPLEEPIILNYHFNSGNGRILENADGLIIKYTTHQEHSYGM